MTEDVLNDEIRRMYEQDARSRAIDSETLRVPIRELELKQAVALTPASPVLEAAGESPRRLARAR